MKHLLLFSSLLIICFNSFSQHSEASLKIISDIPYYQELAQKSDLQKLNIALPPNAHDVPVLIWIGGGAWSYVDRNMEMDLAKKLAMAGIAVVVPGHRLSPAVWKDPSLTTGISHPEHVRDIAMAVKWTYDHAATYGYSQKKIFIGGFSSGAHLSALIAMDDRYLNALNLSPAVFAGIIPIAGTYDIPHYYKVLSEGNPELADTHVKSVFGNTEKDFIDASPTTYIEKLTIPMLLISESTTYKYTAFFEDKLMQTSYRDFQTIHFHKPGHGELWKDMSFAKESVGRDAMLRFIMARSASTK